MHVTRGRWDLRALRPLDTAAILESAARSSPTRLAQRQLGRELSARITEGVIWELDAPVARLCSAEVPMTYAKHLEQAAIPQVDDIVAAAHRVISG